MKALRAFQVISQDGEEVVLGTYNEVDEDGKIKKRNEKDSFYAVDEELKGHIEAIRAYILSRLG